MATLKAKFPGRPSSKNGPDKTRRRSSKVLQNAQESDCLMAAKSIERGLRSFAAIAGDSNEDQSEFQGFSEAEISSSKQKAAKTKEIIQTHIDFATYKAVGSYFIPQIRILSASEKSSKTNQRKAAITLEQLEVEAVTVPKPAPVIETPKPPTPAASTGSSKKSSSAKANSSAKKKTPAPLKDRTPKASSSKQQEAKTPAATTSNKKKESNKNKKIPSAATSASTPSAASKKVLIRPSKLGSLTTATTTTPENSVVDKNKPDSKQKEQEQGVQQQQTPDGYQTPVRGSGKRQIKPSFKIRQKNETLFGKSAEDKANLATPEGQKIQKSIAEYANAVATSEENPKAQEKIERILASQWDSRRKKNASGSKSATPEASGGPQKPDVSKPVIRASKLVLNQKLLQRLRDPGHQVEFYQAIQRSMQSADKVPPKLVIEGSKTSINPAGTALVEEDKDDIKEASGSKVAKNSNNRMPGNIVCGICGAVRYYAFVLQAKKFGTFSCEPCRKFISKTIKKAQPSSTENDDAKPDEVDAEELYHCVSSTGMCVVPPVLRNNPNAPKKKEETSSVRCEACWLKLCLIGYQLDDALYDRLRSLLPLVFHDLLPDSKNRHKNQALLPNRGEILEFNKQIVPLSRPLFDGFGTPLPKEKEVKPEPASSSKSPGKRTATTHVVYERLPNGWSKKAVKRLTGSRKGMWDMYLITPDQSLLKNPTELKLYIAKSGSVIDSNIVNFSLPKKTAKVDKALKLKSLIALAASKEKSEIAKDATASEPAGEASDKKQPKSGTSTPGSAGARTPRKCSKKILVLPKSSRREVKVPLKYREEGEAKSEQKSTKSPKSKNKKKAEDPIEVEAAQDEMFEEIDVEVGGDQEDVIEQQEKDLAVDDLDAIAREAASVAVKSAPSFQKLSSLGVGTFSIDEETARGMSGGRFTKRIKIKRCGKCQGCNSKNCGECFACKDMLKHGGPGSLKQACVNRRCEAPTMPGIPAFKTANDVKTKYFKSGSTVSKTSRVIMPSLGVSSMTSVAPASSKTEDKRKEISRMREDDSDDEVPPIPAENRIPVPPPSLDRPKLSYSTLIAMAIQNSPKQRATLQEIYAWIEDHFPYFDTMHNKTGWQNSIRHNLSLNKAFYRSHGQAARKGGGFWNLDPTASIGAFKKVKKSKLVQRQKHDTSMWEADPDSYIDRSFPAAPLTPPEDAPPEDGSISFGVTASGTPVIIGMSEGGDSSTIGPSPIKRRRMNHQPGDDEADRRQSLEEFVEMGLSSSPTKGSDNLTYSTKPTTVYVTEQNVDVPLPPVTISGSSSSKAERKVIIKANDIEGLAAKKATAPYLGTIDYVEAYDEDQVNEDGQAVITTETLPVESLCFLCGSAGQEEMLYCRSCCEPYHPFCLNQEELPQSAEAENDWVCRRCAVCSVCGNPEGAPLRCTKCTLAFHEDCLLPGQKKMISQQSPTSWLCGQCLRCKSCDKANVMHFDSEDAEAEAEEEPAEKIPLCDSCCLQKKKGSYCPLCNGAYDDNDYDTRMMECAKCGGWIHAKCEDVNAEKYQILSYLPDSVEFVCKKCHNNDEEIAPWRKAVLNEIKIGQKIILEELSKLKTLKIPSPTKPTTPMDQSSLDHAKRQLSFEDIDSASDTKEAQFVKECGVKQVDKLDRKCSVVLKDVKHHPWWGKKVRQLSGDDSKKSIKITDSCEKFIKTPSKVIIPKILKRDPPTPQPSEASSEKEPTPEQNTQIEENNDSPAPMDTAETLLRDLESVQAEIVNDSDIACNVPQEPIEIREAFPAQVSNLEAKIEDGSYYENNINFHLDLKRFLLNTVAKDGLERSELHVAYDQITKQIFPWFDINNPLKHFEALKPEESLVRPPKPYDHAYADYKMNKRKPSLVSPISQPPKWKAGCELRTSLSLDQRLCSFCGQYGDLTNEMSGRLLYYKQNEWVHANCALWASEVYEDEFSLINVGTALNRGLKLYCTVCKRRGAAIGCCHEYCKENYHFECGQKAMASFKEDKTVYCRRHKQFYSHKNEQIRLSVDRTVHVDLEQETAKRKIKPVDLREVKVTIGSLTVESLGAITDQRNGHPDALIPSGFTCSRWFWSTLDPSRKVKYYCNVKLKETVEDEIDETVLNVAVDHEKVDDLEAEAVVSDLMKKLRKIELEKLKQTEKVKKSNIIPPYAVSTLWSAVSYKDLHREDEPGKNVLDVSRWIERSHGLRGRTISMATTVTNTSSLPSSNRSPLLASTPNASPCKGLNKAVSNVLKRTPSKLFEDGDFNLDFPHDDFIKDILDGPSNIWDETGEVSLIQTWFNQNKKVKVSEVAVQCCLPFTKTNFQIDAEIEALEEMEGDDEDEEEEEYYDEIMEEMQEESLVVPAPAQDQKIEQPQQQIDNFEIDAEPGISTPMSYTSQTSSLNDEDRDLLTYVAEKIEKINRERLKQEQQDEEVDIMKILGLDSEDIEVREEEVTEEVDEANSESSVNNNDIDCPSNEVSPQKISLLDGISQLDGADDGDETSPRKDFTIAGLLSPPPPTQQPQAQVQQPPPPPPANLATLAYQGPPLAAPRPPPPTPFAPAIPAIPGLPTAVPGGNVYIQHLPSPALASTFAQQFTQQTGRPLQYLTSMPATAAAAPQAAFCPVQMQPQLSYVTPQGIILNPQQPSFFQPAPGTFFAQPAPAPQPQFATFPQAASITRPPMAVANAQPSSVRKVAHVQPQQRARDPIKALSNMASQPMSSISTTPSAASDSGGSRGSELSITHQRPPSVTRLDFHQERHHHEKQRSVGTQAKIAGPLKIISPRPWKEVRTPEQTQPPTTVLTIPPGPSTMSSGVSSRVSSRPSSNRSASNDMIFEVSGEGESSSRMSTPRPAPQWDDHSYFCSSPDVKDTALITDEKVVDGMKVTTKRSNKHSIKLTMQKDLDYPNNSRLKVQNIVVQDGRGAMLPVPLDPKAAASSLKAKRKARAAARIKEAAFVTMREDSEKTFVNEVVTKTKTKEEIKKELESEDSDSDEADADLDERFIFEMTSDDGFKASSHDATKLWVQVFNAVQEARLQHGLNPLVFNPIGQSGLEMLGLTHSALAFLLEQLPGAKSVESYKFVHHHLRPSKSEADDPATLKENPSGTARSEGFKDRSPLDMFSWLASRHRKRPKIDENASKNPELEVKLAAARRATSLDLPMAMRFRHLAKNAKEAVGVFSSQIHGRGLFCKREIQPGEMVIEYAGEEIRAILTDKREKYYESRGIGCYMFRIDDDTVVDATMKGNAARFINHSCDPNCYSKIVDVLGKKHIIIFAMRKILPGEELTYDYKFPIEDVKIPCSCSARKCRKYMN